MLFLYLCSLKGPHRYVCEIETNLLNQACASQRLARAWFFKIAFVHDVGVCVCVCVRVCVCPQGYNLHSHDNEPIQPAEQVCSI